MRRPPLSTHIPNLSIKIVGNMQPCLPVPRRRKREDEGSDQPSFENIDSMDASEYLSAVVREANALPEVFVADSKKRASSQQEPNKHETHAPIDGSAASISYLVSDRTSVWPPPSANHLPKDTRAWVDVTLANFSELRSYLDRCSREGIGGKASDRIPVPRMKDRPGWHVFCVGKDEARGNTGSYFDDDEEDDGGAREEEEAEGEGVKEVNGRVDKSNNNGIENDAESDWRENLPAIGYHPSVELVLQLDQVMVRRVLSHLAFYATEGWTPCSPQRTAWLYALLARVERPLHRDHVAMLYSLLKELTLVRSKLDPTRRDELARANLLIVIVGIYFEQGGGYSNIMETS